MFGEYEDLFSSPINLKLLVAVDIMVVGGGGGRNVGGVSVKHIWNEFLLLKTYPSIYQCSIPILFYIQKIIILLYGINNLDRFFW